MTFDGVHGDACVVCARFLPILYSGILANTAEGRGPGGGLEEAGALAKGSLALEQPSEKGQSGAGAVWWIWTDEISVTARLQAITNRETHRGLSPKIITID